MGSVPGLVLSWPDAVVLAGLTASVWALLAASAERIVSAARPRRGRSGPSRPGTPKAAPGPVLGAALRPLRRAR